MRFDAPTLGTTRLNESHTVTPRGHLSRTSTVYRSARRRTPAIFVCLLRSCLGTRIHLYPARRGANFKFTGRSSTPNICTAEQHLSIANLSTTSPTESHPKLAPKFNRFAERFIELGYPTGNGTPTVYSFLMRIQWRYSGYGSVLISASLNKAQREQCKLPSGTRQTLDWVGAIGSTAGVRGRIEAAQYNTRRTRSRFSETRFTTVEFRLGKHRLVDNHREKPRWLSLIKHTLDTRARTDTAKRPSAGTLFNFTSVASVCLT